MRLVCDGLVMVLRPGRDIATAVASTALRIYLEKLEVRCDFALITQSSSIWFQNSTGVRLDTRAGCVWMLGEPSADDGSP